MNIIIIPFHDWRKISKEGFRTRDSHFIQHFITDRRISKLVIINRPITYAEVLVKKYPWKTKGNVIVKGFNYQLVQINEKCYVFDFLSYEIIHQLFLKKKWFFRSYGSECFYRKLIHSLKLINFNPEYLLCHNIFAYRLVNRFDNLVTVFDAFDNFLKFPLYTDMQKDIYISYYSLFNSTKIITTNSEQNKEYFNNEFNLKNIFIIRNGVDIERFNKKYEVPEELRKISKPIVGIGAKITHLLDVKLLNFLIEENPDINFVLIGQIIDKQIFYNINKLKNFRYLGDKHYDIYPAFIQAFDVCLLPYVTGKQEHGQDSIKVYEYIAAGKPVISTKVGGSIDLAKYIKIAENNEDFNLLLKEALKFKFQEYTLPLEFTWNYKTDTLIKILNRY